MFASVVGTWVALSIVVGVYAFKKGLNGMDYFFRVTFSKSYRGLRHSLTAKPEDALNPAGP